MVVLDDGLKGSEFFFCEAMVMVGVHGGTEVVCYTIEFERCSRRRRRRRMEHGYECEYFLRGCLWIYIVGLVGLFLGHVCP